MKRVNIAGASSVWGDPTLNDAMTRTHPDAQPMTKLKIKHSHGLTEYVIVDGDTHEALDDARDHLSDLYGDKVEYEGDLADGRILVWRDEASARDDDGARSVASISTVGQRLVAEISTAS